MKAQVIVGRTRIAPAVALLASSILLAVAAPAEETGVHSLMPSPERASIRISEASEADGLTRHLAIERGKSIFAHTDFRVKRVSVGDPKLLEVVVLSPQQIQLVAKDVGATNVLLWDSKGEPKAAIQVDVGAAGTDLERRLRGFLPSSEIKVTATGQGLVLSGSVPSAVAAEQALVLTRAFVGSTGSDIVNLLEVGGNHQVMLKVVIAEMSRTVTREFGTNFNALIKAGNGNIAIAGLLGGLTSPAGDGNVLLSEAVNVAAGFSQFGALRQLQVFLDVLDERGLTRILAEPTLVARSGKSASFLVGGEIPIPIAQGGAFGSITVEYHHFGVGLKFTPTVLGPNRIHLEVEPEVSQPDFTFGTEVGGTLVSAFNTRRAATSIELENGQSFVIAGLLNEELRQQVSQYPLLGQIPLLGALFRSSKYQRNETELVIMITPSLVKPLGPGPHRLPTDSFIDPSPWEFYAMGWMEGRPPEPADLIDGEVQDAVQVEMQNGGGLIGDAGYEAPAAWDESSNASEETTHE
jgi:pilus assembly protein CpaC